MSKKLIEYVRGVVDLEKSLYLQTQAINRMEWKISQLCKSKCLQKPALPHEASMEYGAILGWAGIGLLVGIGPALVSQMLAFVIIFPLIFALPMFIIECINVKNENEDKWAKYHADLSHYNEAAALDEKRMRQETEERGRMEEALRFMKEKRSETYSLLKRFYTLNIIYPKYRNLVAMCSIYDYLVSGRCTQLEGHEGAYNKFDQELQMGIIIAKLDTVLEKLDYIRENQFMLYDAIDRGNRLSQQLIENSEHQIRLAGETLQKTELGAYYQRQIANEANQIKWLMMYK